ncbi:MAG: hypothetical protein ACJARN_001286, partial [Arenicella sp.]
QAHAMHSASTTRSRKQVEKYSYQSPRVVKVLTLSTS